MGAEIHSVPQVTKAALRAKLFNAQSKSKAFVIGERHYDIGNRLFTVMLDKRMNYSCGYWADANTAMQAPGDSVKRLPQKDKLQ